MLVLVAASWEKMLSCIFGNFPECLFRLSYASKLWSENCIFKKNIPSLTQPRTVWVLIRLRGHFKTSLNVKIQEFGKNHDDLKDATITYLGTSGYRCICCLVVLNKIESQNGSGDGYAKHQLAYLLKMWNYGIPFLATISRLLVVISQHGN